MVDRNSTDGNGSVGLGVRLGIPIGFSFFVFGLTFGVAAIGQGLTPLSAGLASMFVFSGSSQFLILDSFGHPKVLAAIALSVFLLNIRHIVMGATLLSSTPTAPLWLRVLGLLFMIDETWAVAMSPEAKADRLRVLIGCGIVAMAAWVLGTILGAILSKFIVDPKRFGIDFVYFAVFLFILVSIWRQNRNILPWVVAVLVALLTQSVTSGKWYVVVGGVAGAIAGGLRPWISRAST